jgi:hypothetical protein
LRNWAEPIRGVRSSKEQRFFAAFFQKRSPSFLLLAALAGCGPQYDPLTRPGLWQFTHSNRADLVMQVANPSDLTFGKGTTGSDGQLDSAAVERLRTGKVKKLQDSGIAQISVTGGAGADTGSTTNSSQ